MNAKNYYIESDAVDMCIERLSMHSTTIEERALIAMSFMAPGHADVSRLIEAILYGGSNFDEIENMRLLDEAERKEVEEFMKELEAEDGKNDM